MTTTKTGKAANARPQVYLGPRGAGRTTTTQKTGTTKTLATEQDA